MARSLLAAALAGGVAAQYYKIDPSFPAPGALPVGVEEVTAVAVVNATSGRGGVEVHVAQRNASHPYFMVLDPASGKLLRTWNGSLVSPHGMVADPSGESIWVADIAGDQVQQYAIGGKLMRAVGSKGALKSAACGSRRVWTCVRGDAVHA
jgi:DNA-binding beta-propeller fold protein YncE